VELTQARLKMPRNPVSSKNPILPYLEEVGIEEGGVDPEQVECAHDPGLLQDSQYFLTLRK
jgi:hypothetical protein